MKQKIREAFLAVRQGFSADRVVADPDINECFIERCRQLGLTSSATVLNSALLNARKAGFLADCKTSNRTSFDDEPEYAFASEIAARYLERRSSTTIDAIICSPQDAREFDEVAARIVPGYTALQYRWAGLNLRKERSLAPERMSHIVASEKVELQSLSSLNLESVPANQGLYIFVGSGSMTTLYVGESENLRKRIAKHLEHSDNKGLARWLWEHGTEEVWLEYHLLPPATSLKVRRALEHELIHSRKPVFNVWGK